MQTLNISDIKAMLIYIADSIIKSKPYLTEVDREIGDGDHGIGMENGMKKAKENLESMADVNNVYDLFFHFGKAMLMSMGGASGVLFSTLFIAGSKNMLPKTEINAQELASMVRKGLMEIQKRGKAQVGDKTMVDALDPAVRAMEAFAEKGLLPMFLEAEKAAYGGMEATKNYVAKFGRSKSLMERAIGYQDAGATSIWIIFRSMREFIEKMPNDMNCGNSPI